MSLKRLISAQEWVERVNTPGQPRLVLVGPMGTGKTSIGARVANALNLKFVDVDQLIEETLSINIPDYFNREGELAFRKLEERFTALALSMPNTVVALGGGAVMAESVRNRLQELPTVALWDSPDDVINRLGNTDRPLLQTPNPAATWAQIAANREKFYLESSAYWFDTHGIKRPEIVTELLDLISGSQSRLIPATADSPAKILVGQADTGYYTYIGRNLDAQIVAAIPSKAAKVLLVHPPVLAERAEKLRQLINLSGKEALLAEVPDAEAAKSARVMEFLWQVLGQSGFTRSDVIIGFGGGSVTDLAGFAAASWLRGIGVIQVPTTVAGLVDAAVGGKTGINTAEGKNLVGAFHPPLAVIGDLNELLTLPANEVVAGFAEAVKCGFIADETILTLIEQDPKRALDVRSPEFAEIVVRSVLVKAIVVSNDLKESGQREFLNYGHTFGHAIERCERYQWRHGAAVSVGMMYVAELAVLAGKLSSRDLERQRSILESLGLPTKYVSGRWEELLTAMKRDKKTRGNLLRFVVLERFGSPSRLEGPDPALLQAAYAAISE